MNGAVPLIMFGWIPAVVALFALLPPRRAVIAAFLVAWLFLPIAAYKVPGITDYTKMTATSLGVLLGVVLFDSRRIWALRPSLVDLPFALWCIAKFGTSISNGLGIYDGLSSVEYHLIVWGVPYGCGRLYFSDTEGVRELAVGLVIGGLVYVPLCLFEIRMSPQLHVWIYGFHQHSWVQAKRADSWRPTVFMQHGLMVGMWMCMTGMLAWWLWIQGGVRKLGVLHIGWAAIAILATALACRSLGALALLGLGTVALWTARLCRSAIPLWCLLALAPLYMGVRLAGVWAGEGLVQWSRAVGSEERAGSLQSRLDSETQFIRAGWHRPLLGFRGWYNTADYWEKDQRAIPDALWMIEFTGQGLLGLAGLTLFLLLPPAWLLWRLSFVDLRSSECAPAIGLAVVVVLYMMDNLFNGMVNPVFAVATGAVAGLSVMRGRIQKAFQPGQAPAPVFASAAGPWR